jgi:hypothetical protein
MFRSLLSPCSASVRSANESARLESGNWQCIYCFARRPGKDAVRLGADEVLVSRDSAAMATQAGSFHFVIDMALLKQAKMRG